MAKVNPIPEGNGEPTPYLAVDGAAKVIDFSEKVFGAREVFRHESGGSGQFTDPWGHVGNVSTHVEDVSPEELDRRAR